MNSSCSLASVLDDRLDARVDSMLEQGLVAELTEFHRQYNEDRLKEGRSVLCYLNVKRIWFLVKLIRIFKAVYKIRALFMPYFLWAKICLVE